MLLPGVKLYFFLCVALPTLPALSLTGIPPLSTHSGDVAQVPRKKAKAEL